MIRQFTSALFAGISEEDLTDMLSCLGAKEKKLAKGAFLFMEGDPAGTIALILQGSLEVSREDFDGNRSILGLFEEGELVGEAFACSGRVEFPVNVVAASDAIVLLLDAGRVLATCPRACPFHQTLIRNLLGIVAQKNILMNRKLRILGHKTTKEKLLAYLTEISKEQHSRDITIPLDRQALADYLGVERSALSAEIGKLIRADVIRAKKNHFMLL